MIVRNPAGTISRVRLIAVLIASLTVAFQSAACGDRTKGGEPGRATVKPSKPSDVNPISGVVTVTPSTGLKSTGDSPVAITVSVSGFQPNMEVFAGQHWGRVDCTVDPCYVGVGNHTQGAASDRISFESA